MSQGYDVVFEYTKYVGGYAGVRFVIPYSNKTNFNRINSIPNRRTNIIAQGVSEEQALNLCALTPEICQLTAIIDEICHSQDGRINQKLIVPNLAQVISTIEEYRERRQEYGLRPKPGFSFVDIEAQEPSERKSMYQFVMNRFYRPDGNLPTDLQMVKKMMTIDLSKIVLFRI